MAKRIYFGTVLVKGFEKSVADQLYDWLESAPQDDRGGVANATARKRNKILDKIDAARNAEAKFVDIDDDQLDTFKNAIELTRVLFTNKGWLEIQDRVLKAKTAPKEGEVDKNDPANRPATTEDE